MLFLTITVSIGLSRLYLGAHWLTDIIGSYLIGLFFLCFHAYLNFKFNKNTQFRLNKWLTLSLVALLIPWLTFTITQHHQEVFNYTPKNNSITLSSEQWWLNPSNTINSNHIPLYRNDRFGAPRQPLNIQWQGSIDKIKSELIKMGFTHHETHASLKRDIESMSNITADQQPLLPWLYKNTRLPY